FELSSTSTQGPVVHLYLFRKVPHFRVFVCGGRWYFWLGSEFHRKAKLCVSSSSCYSTCRNRE
ncbi:unnamed protein product, partial [Prunus brigantina]